MSSNLVHPDTNIFLYHDNANILNDIYLLRYNIDKIDHKFKLFMDTHFDDIYEKIKKDDPKFKSDEEVIRLGYFLLNTDINTITFDYLEIDYTIPGVVSTVNYNKFLQYLNDILFQEFIFYLLKKAHYEMLLRKKPSTYFSIDLYYNRSSTRQNQFHVDSIPEMPVDFFTLTYILPNDIIMKGLTVISKNTDTLQQNYSLSLAIKNGTTLGIDNDIMYHATPSSIIARQGSELIFPIFELFDVPEQNIRLLHRRQQNPNIGNINVAVDQKRSFIRNWYYSNSAIVSFIKNSKSIFTIENDNNIFYQTYHLDFQIFQRIQYNPNDNDFVNNLIKYYSPLTLGGEKMNLNPDYNIVSTFNLKNKNKKKSPNNKVTLAEIQKLFENPDSNFIIYTKKSNKKSKSNKKLKSKSNKKSNKKLNKKSNKKLKSKSSSNKSNSNSRTNKSNTNSRTRSKSNKSRSNSEKKEN